MGNRTLLIKGLTYLLLLVLIILSFSQIYIQRFYIHRWLVDTYRTYQLSGMRRSANFIVDREGADFLEFIKINTQENGPVIVPQHTSTMLREQSVMQFFLMPRGIPSCRCDSDPAEYTPECIECLRQPSHLVPAVDNFPDPAVMEGYKQFVPFPVEDNHYKGIYVSSEAEPVLEIPQPERMAGPLLGVLVLDIVILVAILFSGGLIIRAIIPGLPLSDIWLSAFPVGAGFLTWFVFITGWLGGTVNIFLFLAIWLLITIPVLIVNIRRKNLPFPQKINLPDHPHIWGSVKQNPLFTLLVLIAAALIVSMYIISIGRGYSLFDGIANWALKGYGIALEKSIRAGQYWGGHGLSYPQNIHLLIALFKFADNDLLQGSKLLFPSFSILMALTCYRSWIQNHTPKLISAAALILLLSIPELYNHSTYGWSNIIFTSYLVMGSIHLSAGLQKNSSPKIFLGSILLGLAGWTRPEGIGFAVAIAVATVSAVLLFTKNRDIPVLYLSPIIIIPGIWLLFSFPYMSGDEIGRSIEAFISTIKDGAFNFDALKILIQFGNERFSNREIWGGFYPLLVFAGPVLLLSGYRKRKDSFIILFASAAAAFLIPNLMFFIAYFEKKSYMRFLLVSYDRALFPGVVLLLCAFISLVLHIEDPPDPIQIFFSFTRKFLHPTAAEDQHNK